MRLVTAIPPPPADTSERADRSAIQDEVEPAIVVGPGTMSPRAHRRWLLAILPLCGIARPVFADGAIPSSEEISRFLITAAVLILLAIVVLILLVRAIVKALQRREDRPAEPANPAVPAARVVRDRSRSS